MINLAPAATKARYELGRLYLGTYTVGGDLTKKGGTQKLDPNTFDQQQRNRGAQDVNQSNGDPNTKNFLNNHTSTQAGKLEFPILTSPASAFNLLLGKDVDLFRYTLPSAGINIRYSQAFQLWGPLFAGFDGSLHHRLALLAQFDGEGDPQYRVLGPEADQHQHADLEVDIVVEAAQPVKDQGAEDAEGHRCQDGAGQDPRLELGRQHEKDDNNAEYKGVC